MKILSRRRRDQVLSALMRGLVQAFRLCTWRGAQRCGATLGRLAWRIARRDRARILRHLELAFPQASTRERHRLGRQCMRHHGVSLGECLYLMTRDCGAVAEHVRVEGWKTIERVRAVGDPVLIVTGHCGNWELLAATANCRGLGVRVVGRELGDENYQNLLLDLRSRFGTETITRGTAGAARQLLGTLRDHGVLGILIDQDTQVDGVWVPFFERPAYTPIAAALLAQRHGTVVIPAFIERRADGSHLARFHPPLELPEDPTEATARMHRCIESQIRRVPEQWVWMHRRWRRQPDESGGTVNAAD
jgi:KDO2-lipid IV(A) lauroyltransferase